MRPRRRGRGGASPTTVATVVQRLAVLLEAGLTPLAAWHAIAREPSADGVVRGAAASAQSAHELPAALRRSAEQADDAGIGSGWPALAAALEVAGVAGAPLASTLDRLADVLRARAQTDRDVASALAGPMATSRVVVLLPVVGLLFAAAIGVDVLHTLFATPAGWVCLTVGSALIGLAAAWTRRLVRRAGRGRGDPGLEPELLAIALSGGIGVDRARALVAGVLPSQNGGDDLAGPVLAFAARSGVPAAALLRAEAEEARRSAAADAQRRAAVLGVKLLLPLGICVLPAFVAVGVAPVVLSLLTSTFGGR